MSNFSYYLGCSTCNMVSYTYPFLTRDTFSNVFVFPVANRLTKEFEEIEVNNTEEVNNIDISDTKLKMISQKYKTESLQICVPKLVDYGEMIQLMPSMICPRCHNLSVKSILGSSPIDIILIKNINEIIKNLHSVENVKFNYKNIMLIQIYPNKYENINSYRWSFRIYNRNDECRKLVSNICNELKNLGCKISDFVDNENYICFYELDNLTKIK